MSGRLVILPKKSYCPWNPANVERVLRDERLERERVEKEQSLLLEEERSAKASRLRQFSGRLTEDGNGDRAAEEQVLGHMNLFPEARDAELTLAHGNSTNAKAANNSSSGENSSGVLPVPLGGEEASNRKIGNVPFYMRPSFDDGNSEGQGKYGIGKYAANGLRRGAAVADEITSKIMRDQYQRREDSRKLKIDPMHRFMVKENEQMPVKCKETTSAKLKKSNGSTLDSGQGLGKKQTNECSLRTEASRHCSTHANSPNRKPGKDNTLHDNKNYNKKRKKSSGARDSYSLGIDSSSSRSSSSESFSSASISSSSDFSSSDHHHYRRRSKHSHRRSHRKSSSRGKSRERRRKRKEKNSRKERVRSNRHRRDRNGRHGYEKSSSNHRVRHSNEHGGSDERSKFSASNCNGVDGDSKAAAKSTTTIHERTDVCELQELRQRRRAREAREVERERQILSNSTSGLVSGDRNRSYQNQFNPNLSRK